MADLDSKSGYDLPSEEEEEENPQFIHSKLIKVVDWPINPKNINNDYFHFEINENLRIYAMDKFAKVELKYKDILYTGWIRTLDVTPRGQVNEICSLRFYEFTDGLKKDNVIGYSRLDTMYYLYNEANFVEFDYIDSKTWRKIPEGLKDRNSICKSYLLSKLKT